MCTCVPRIRSSLEGALSPQQDIVPTSSSKLTLPSCQLVQRLSWTCADCSSYSDVLSLVRESHREDRAWRLVGL